MLGGLGLGALFSFRLLRRGHLVSAQSSLKALYDHGPVVLRVRARGLFAKGLFSPVFPSKAGCMAGPMPRGASENLYVDARLFAGE
jgi:hypothetical protein